MPSQEIINLIITGAGAIIGWFLKAMWEAVRDLKQDIRDIESELHTKYVSKDDYKDDIAEIKDILKQIFSKLDTKADK
jgi:hypothetical protein